jgi:hypothetical protein
MRFSERSSTHLTGRRPAATPPPRTRTPGRARPCCRTRRRCRAPRCGSGAPGCPSPARAAPVRVRGLGRRPDGELVGDRVVVGHQAAGLQRRRVHPRVDQVAGAHVLGGGERGVGGRGVARLQSKTWLSGLSRTRGASASRRGGRRSRRAAARTRRRSARARRGRRSGSPRRRTPPPAPGSAPRRWRAPACTSCESVGIQARPRSASCSPVMTARTSGCDSAASVSTATIRARACGLRSTGGVQHAGQGDVVDEPPAAAHEPGVLLARHPTEAHGASAEGSASARLTTPPAGSP